MRPAADRVHGRAKSTPRLQQNMRPSRLTARSSLSQLLNAREFGLDIVPLSAHLTTRLGRLHAISRPLRVMSSVDVAPYISQFVTILTVTCASQRAHVAAASADGRFVVFYAPLQRRSRARLDEWDAAANTLASHVAWHQPLRGVQITDICFNSSATLLLCTNSGGELRCYGHPSPSLLSTLLSDEPLTALHIHGEDSVAILTKQGRLHVAYIRDYKIEYSGTNQKPAHSGVGKCVRWRDRSTILTCGNDRRIHIFDVRCFATAQLSFPNAHTRAINHVSWHPYNPYVFLSSSYDGFIKVYDSRSCHSPIMTANSHGRNEERKFAHRPCFYKAGQCILTSGDGHSHLTQYSTMEGRVIAQHDLGFTRAPNVLICNDSSGMVTLSLTRDSLIMTVSDRNMS